MILPGLKIKKDRKSGTTCVCSAIVDPHPFCIPLCSPAQNPRFFGDIAVAVWSYNPNLWPPTASWRFSCEFLLIVPIPRLPSDASAATATMALQFGFFLPQDKFTILFFSYGRFFSWWIIYSSSNWNDTIQRIFDKQMLFWNPNSSAFIISWIIPNWWWSNDGWSGGNLGHKFSPPMWKRLRIYNFSSRLTF